MPRHLTPTVYTSNERSCGDIFSLARPSTSEIESRGLAGATVPAGFSAVDGGGLCTENAEIGGGDCAKTVSGVGAERRFGGRVPFMCPPANPVRVGDDIGGVSGDSGLPILMRCINVSGWEDAGGYASTDDALVSDCPLGPSDAEDEEPRRLRRARCRMPGLSCGEGGRTTFWVVGECVASDGFIDAGD